ncbi:MAG TPA: histidine kinase [Chitinophagaceae bacterium]|nr:histidine kinase [Chitinophagaceae bacterium]
MNNYKENAFIFSSRYRLLRHIIFWVVHIILFSLIYSGSFSFKTSNATELLLTSTIWVLPYILYAYPVMYWFIPKYLLKQKYLQFGIIIIGWAISGWFLNYLFRANVLNSFREYFNFPSGGATGVVSRNPWSAATYFNMNMMAAFCSMIVLFKFWIIKQRELMQAEKEKVTAELQLLKAQVHPHFLFNTLNNIYSVSLETSPKTSQLILKLSSLLNYILYECKTERVLLEKEIKVMKDYIDLEKERYANKLEISLNIEGDIKDKYIAPLLLLPFLENAFKHGTSEQLEKPWLSMNLTVNQNMLRCKIANSKNADVTINENGIGIINVKKRLAFIYPGVHQLEINNEEDFFVAALTLQLQPGVAIKPPIEKTKTVTETFLSNDTALSISR